MTPEAQVTGQSANTVKNPQGNREVIEKAVGELLLVVNKYLVENRVTLLDSFLIAHSLHKVLVFGIAMNWDMQGTPAEKVYREADMTWRVAMRELWRQLKPVSQEYKLPLAGEEEIPDLQNE